MNIRNAAGAGIAAGLLIAAVGCGGGSGQAMTSPTAPTSPTNPPSSGGGTQIYNVTDLQALAKTTSETSDPVTIDDNAVMLQPANDDTSDPVAVGQ